MPVQSKENAEIGIVFPQQNDGKRSSTAVGTDIVSAALMHLNPSWAQAAASETHWRRNYPTHFYRLVEGGLKTEALAIASAQAALDMAWNRFCLVPFRPDVGSPELVSEEPKLTDAYRSRSQPNQFQTKIIHGEGNTSPKPWCVPYKGGLLEGQALIDAIHSWRDRNIMEPSAADALLACAQHPEWFDLSDRNLVLLGAGSEAGPLSWLVNWRANIYAVDLPRPAIWARIDRLARAGNAKVFMPEGPDNALGVNLTENPQAIAAWLTSFSLPMDIAAHAYADGERHVRVVMACDFVQQAVLDHTKTLGVQSSLAFMATPTDTFAVPESSALVSQATYASRPLISKGLQRSLRLASGERFFQPNIESLIASETVSGEIKRYGIADSLVLEQGPNYALAKRLQQWRAIVARAQGTPVSLNVAPSTTTTSVVKNPALAAGFAGADTFGMEVFEPETTNALMAAMWVHDLRNAASSANPVNKLAHPYELFMQGANHGGLWTCGYRPRSALPFAAALGWVRRKTL
jgi:hypothetical protein